LYDRYFGQVAVSHGWSGLVWSLLFIVGLSAVLVLPVFGDPPDGLAFAMAWIVAPVGLWVFFGTALIAPSGDTNWIERAAATVELPFRVGSHRRAAFASGAGYILFVG
jgi:hypothetical protein